MNTYLRGTKIEIDAPSGVDSLRVAGGGHVATVAVNDGKATFTSAMTSTMPDAVYVSEWVQADGADSLLIEGPRFIIAPSITGGGVTERVKSTAEQMLDAIDKALLQMSDSGVVSIGTDGVSYSYETRGELMAYREQVRSLIARERHGHPVGARARR